MGLLDLKAFDATPLKSDPYDYLVVKNFVPAEAMPAVIGDFPAIDHPGSFPLTELKIQGVFADLLDEMNQAPFREAVERKFDIDLTGKPTMFTVRGRLAKRSGGIHTDTESKIITVLLYLNDHWDAQGGRLRILRSGDDLEDYVEEVEPGPGTLLIFRRNDHSWHGHEPFEGPRRAVQMNWVTSAEVVAREQARHKVTAFLKRINPFAQPSAY